MPSPSNIILGVARPNLRSRPLNSYPFSGVQVLWDSVNKSPDVTISGDGLIATHTGAGANDAAGRADTALTENYWEMEVTADTGGVGGGIVNSLYDFAIGQWLGLAVNGMGFYNDGTVYQDYNTIFTGRFGGFPTFTVGNRLQFAFSAINLKLWMRVNGGPWNNDGVSNDPATNTGGIGVNTSPVLMGTGPFYAGYNVFTGGSIVTLKSASVSWNNVAPAGFNQIGS